MPNPTVDILMATYAGERYVGEQIESIQGQTYQDWRLLVSDDCSADGTLEVVGRYAAEDPRISVVSEGVRYGGAKENFFSLLDQSTAPYFMFCDQDDVWLPGKVGQELTIAQAKESETGSSTPVAIYTDMRVVDDGLQEIAPSFLAQDRKDGIRGDLHAFLGISGAAGCTMLGNEALRKLLAGSDFSAALMHDWWVGIVAASCGKLVYLDEATVLYRQHGDNEIGAETYSFWDRVAHFRQSRAKYWRTCAQAKAILSQYGEYMTIEGREVVGAYASQLDGGFAENVRVLSHEGLLKEGAGRRCAQLLTLALGAPTSKARA
jgi:glycosyltransferase involved in cell wall biosynthesis